MSKHYAMTAYKGNGGRAPLILNFGTRWSGANF
jgi:hypothetical protein